MNAIIDIQKLTFAYHGTDFRLAIDDLSVTSGEKVAFIGPSGSGKTTLLHLIAGIRTPHEGRLVVDGTEIAGLHDAARRSFRIRHIGMVFQEFELLEHLSVLDNILLAFRISPELTFGRDMVDRAVCMARSLEIEDKLRRRIGRLSQGERQRVAVCRALLTEPQLVLADEPTGNLDPTNKGRVLDILFEYAETAQATLVTVTHDHAHLDRFDRTIDFCQFHTTERAKNSAKEGTQ